MVLTSSEKCGTGEKNFARHLGRVSISPILFVVVPTTTKQEDTCVT